MKHRKYLAKQWVRIAWSVRPALTSGCCWELIRDASVSDAYYVSNLSHFKPSDITKVRTAPMHNKSLVLYLHLLQIHSLGCVFFAIHNYDVASS
jgi:hypothetical protein